MWGDDVLSLVCVRSFPETVLSTTVLVPDRNRWFCLSNFAGFSATDENTLEDFASVLIRTIYFLEKEYRWRQIWQQILETNYDRAFNRVYEHRSSRRIISDQSSRSVFFLRNDVLQKIKEISQASMTSSKLRSQPPYEFNVIFKNTLPRNIFQIVAGGVPRIIDKIPRSC